MGKLRSLDDIQSIVLHCSDTPNGREHTVTDIDQWHGERVPPFKRDLTIDPHFNSELAHIGYHYVITLDGGIYTGRPLRETGAHVAKHNHDTIGVCLIGRDKFTPEQWAAIWEIKNKIETKLGRNLPFRAHNQFDKNKTCPGFDLNEYLEQGEVLFEGHVFQTEQPKPQSKQTGAKPMDILSTISGLFKPAADLIDNLHTSTEEEMKLKNELVLAQNKITTQVIQLEAELVKAQQAVIVAEANSQSWLARNWRPITMLTFLILIVCDIFGITEFRLSEQAWDLLKIGIGGYVVGRSAEKIMPNVMKALKK